MIAVARSGTAIDWSDGAMQRQDAWWLGPCFRSASRWADSFLVARVELFFEKPATSRTWSRARRRIPFPYSGGGGGVLEGRETEKANGRKGESRRGRTRRVAGLLVHASAVKFLCRGVTRQQSTRPSVVCTHFSSSLCHRPAREQLSQAPGKRVSPQKPKQSKQATLSTPEQHFRLFSCHDE